MMTNSQIRAEARKTLGDGILTTPWLSFMIVFLVSSAIIGISGFTYILPLIITGPIMIGVYSYVLKVVRFENELNNLGPLADGFKNDIVGNILVCILQTVFIFLWSLIFVIPGIVKAYSYAMTYYIKIDRPNLNANDAITESRKLMDGHKLQLFFLDLSFLGWILVGILTFGIGLLWVIPYMQTARLHFYEEIKPRQTTNNFVDDDDIKSAIS